MSSSKLCVASLEGGEPKYYVREAGRNMKILGTLYDTEEEAFALLRKCEQDDEYAYWQRIYCLGAFPDPRWETQFMRNMTKTEKLLLNYLYEMRDDESNVYTFQCLSDALALTVRQVKTALRALKRRGFTEHEAYFSFDDGLLGGSGYSLTTRGFHEARVLSASPATSKEAGSPSTAAPAPLSELI